MIIKFSNYLIFQVEKLKEEIVQLVNKKGIELPKENNLVHKGNLLESSKTLSESGIVDNDPILLIYNVFIVHSLTPSCFELTISAQTSH